MHPARSRDRAPARADRVALVDLLDRLLAGGVVVSGDITLSVADVDLVTISLRALVASVSALAAERERTERTERTSVPEDQHDPGKPVPHRR